MVECKTCHLLVPLNAIGVCQSCWRVFNDVLGIVLSTRPQVGNRLLQSDFSYSYGKVKDVTWQERPKSP